MLVSVYVTCADQAEAERVARHVLGLRLAACANLWPISSLYWGQGKLEHAQEVALLLKARTESVPALEEAIRSVHSYDIPCVVAWPIHGGNPRYLEWARAEADPAKAQRKV